MRISSEAWAKYQRAHAMLQGEAKQLLEEFFDSLPWDEDEQGCLALLAQRAVELFNHYGLADATLSAAFYDEVMEMQGANVPQAVIPEHDTRYVERDVRGACERAKTRETAKSMSSAALSGHVKRAGIETMRTNAVRDHAMWAWVCIGDSCAFCRTLGSNGWQQASRAVLAGSHAEHIHDNCDCQFVVKRPGETLDIEGYDPDALRREYEDASGKSSKDVINSMRRADYTPEKAAARNARRRELYDQQKAEERNARIRARIDSAEIIHDNLYQGSPKEVKSERERLDKSIQRAWSSYLDGGGTSESYSDTVGNLVRGLSVTGNLDIEDFVDIKKRGHEPQLASWFADAGHTVLLRNPRDDSDTNDSVIDDEIWEFKRLTTLSRKKFRRRITEKLPRQGPNFVVDLSEGGLERPVAEQLIAELLEDPQIEKVMLVMEGSAKLFVK